MKLECFFLQSSYDMNAVENKLPRVTTVHGTSFSLVIIKHTNTCLQLDSLQDDDLVLKNAASEMGVLLL